MANKVSLNSNEPNNTQKNAPWEPKLVGHRTVRRSVAVILCFASVAVLLISVLFKMQIIDHDKYDERVLDQLTVETKVNPNRGEILDRNGNILATNISEYIVIISPQDIIDAMNEKDDDGKTPVFSWTDGSGIGHDGIKMNELIARKLSELPDVKYEDVIEKAAKEKRRYEKITDGVSEEDADKLREFIKEYGLKNQIFLRANSVRFYPYSDLCSHVIGFTNRDGVGIYGLESFYNNVLEGTSGKYITAQDAHSNDMPFTYESFIEAEDGYTVETTIDVYIQYELQNQLEDTYKDNGADERVCGIVMDVNTGAVLAMATYPTFDLNDPYTLDPFSQEKLAQYSADSEEYSKKRFELLYNMWSNKAVTVLYEPGSTFKAITATMGFEENVLKESDTFYCSGEYKVDGYPYPIHCHKTDGHGLVDFVHGLQQSCNPTMMMLSERIGTEKFYKNFRAFGYGDKTGIDLPAESRPIISSEKNFTGVPLAVYSFGQTFKITPIQQIDAISAIANGGKLVTPHLISRIVDKDGKTVLEHETEVKRQVASSESCERVTTILEAGVSGDGGAKNAYVRGYKVAAKTGTSEKKDKYDENGATPYRVGSTVAYAPCESPKIAALIVVDEPTNDRVYGSVVAAPYISNLLSFVLPYLGYEPQYTADELEAVEVTVGTYVGSEKENAVAYAEALGLKYEIIGNGSTVTAQIPEAGTSVLKATGKVLLYTDGEVSQTTAEVPDLLGKTAAVANQMLTNMGLNISFTGTQSMRDGAVVTNQSIESGTQVPLGTVVVLEIKHMDGTD